MLPIESASSLATFEACLSASNLPLRHATVFKPSSPSIFLLLKWPILNNVMQFFWPISQCNMRVRERERENTPLYVVVLIGIRSYDYLFIICSFTTASTHLCSSEFRSDTKKVCVEVNFQINREKGSVCVCVMALLSLLLWNVEVQKQMC